jgi:hypothetical protein
VGRGEELGREKKKRPAAWLALGLERETGWAEKKEWERKGRD